MLAKQPHFQAACTTTYRVACTTTFQAACATTFEMACVAPPRSLRDYFQLRALVSGLHTTTARSRAARKPLRGNRLARASARCPQAASKRDGSPCPSRALKRLFRSRARPICKHFRAPNMCSLQRSKSTGSAAASTQDETLRTGEDGGGGEDRGEEERRRRCGDDMATRRRRGDDDATMNRVHLVRCTRMTEERVDWVHREPGGSRCSRPPMFT